MTISASDMPHTILRYICPPLYRSLRARVIRRRLLEVL